jgi:2',3'-cyclic-nucleotide 2'-phosphodiesterase (5'-nucleotidase family)
MPREDTVVLFHTNDLHGHIENAATLSGLVREERARRPDVLWLDAGDAITGTPVSTVFKGTPIFTVTSAMGIDAGVLGNHEFDHGWQRITDFRETAAYPLLCANATVAGKEEGERRLLGDAPWKVFPVDGVRVGVIGVVSEGTPALTVASATVGVKFETARAALERLVPVVRPKCDLLVALTHVGYEKDIALAQQVKGLDVIVGGHSHTDLPGPVEIGGTLVVQAFRYGERLGRLELTVDLVNKKVVKWEGGPIEVDREKQPSHPGTARIVRELEARVSKQVDVRIGEVARGLGRKDLQRVAERVFMEALETPLGFMNPAGVRGAIRKGPVSIRDIWTAFPFDNTLVRIRCRGERLHGWMKKRLGADFDPGKVYAVATNSYVADHLDRYFPGAEPEVEDTGRTMREAVVDWVREHPDLGTGKSKEGK